MKAYTGGGDRGKTSLLSGERVAKTHCRIEACGDVDAAELRPWRAHLHRFPRKTSGFARSCWKRKGNFSVWVRGWQPPSTRLRHRFCPRSAPNRRGAWRPQSTGWRPSCLRFKASYCPADIPAPHGRTWQGRSVDGRSGAWCGAYWNLRPLIHARTWKMPLRI